MSSAEDIIQQLQKDLARSNAALDAKDAALAAALAAKDAALAAKDADMAAALAAKDEERREAVDKARYETFMWERDQMRRCLPGRCSARSWGFPIDS